MEKTVEAVGGLMFRYFFESKAIFFGLTPQLLILTLFNPAFNNCGFVIHLFKANPIVLCKTLTFQRSRLVK